MAAKVKPAGGKAAEVLGIDKGVSAESTVTVQIQGNVPLREMSGKVKKRFCVVKDGFFLWYEKAPAESKQNRLSFDKKPSGLFPLNMALVQMSKDKSEILLRHNEIPKSDLTLYPDKFEINEWFKKLIDGTNSTWEQAQLGIADLESLKAKGTKLEAEKLEAVRMLQEKIKELEIANKKKNDLMEKEKKQAAKFEKQFGKAREDLQNHEEQLQELEKKYEAEDKEMKKLNEKNKLLEKKLQMAHIALQNLDVDLQTYFGHNLSPGRKEQNQAKHLASPSIKDSAANALQTAMVQSSPQARLKKTTRKVSTMNDLPGAGFRLPKGKAPKLPKLPPAVKSKDEMQTSVSREVVAQSVKAIKLFIDQNRKSRDEETDSEL